MVRVGGSTAMDCLRRHALIHCVFILAACLIFFGGTVSPAGSAESKDVVRVNKRVLTEENLAEVLQKILPAAVFHGGLSEEKKRKHRKEAIEKMIEEELIYQYAEALKMDVPRKQVIKQRDETIERLGGKRGYKKALKQHGISDREYRDNIRRRMLVEKFEKQEIEGKSVVGEEEAREYYEKNKDMYMRPPARRIRHIFISVPPSATADVIDKRKKRAKGILAKLREGQDFAAIAWDYSDGPYRVKGGDMGLIHDGMLDSDLEREVLKLKEGELSGLIRTIYGFHIVRVEDILESEQLGFEDVSGKIRDELTDKRREETRERILNSLRKKADIEMLEK